MAGSQPPVSLPTNINWTWQVVLDELLKKVNIYTTTEVLRYEMLVNLSYGPDPLNKLGGVLMFEIAPTLTI